MVGSEEIVTHILDQAALLPSAWAQHPAEAYSIFNPALGRVQDRLIMAYRVVTPEGRRQIAICELDPATLQPRPETVRPFSDFIREGEAWHADPRWCVYGERLLLHFNNGGQRPNQIYLVEIDPATLAARGPARPLVLDGPRQAVEKNWMLFEHGGELWAVYSICPHVVLSVELGKSGPVYCRRAYRQEWGDSGYAARYGAPRGGAPPVRLGDQYVSFFHSCFAVRSLRWLWLKLFRRRQNKTVRYVGGAYGFAAGPPFSPQWICRAPLLLPPALPRRRRLQLDPRIERSAYPCGAVLQGPRWLVSFGAQEEYCCLATIALETAPSAPAAGQPGEIWRAQ